MVKKALKSINEYMMYSTFADAVTEIRDNNGYFFTIPEWAKIYYKDNGFKGFETCNMTFIYGRHLYRVNGDPCINHLYVTKFEIVDGYAAKQVSWPAVWRGLGYLPKDDFDTEQIPTPIHTLVGKDEFEKVKKIIETKGSLRELDIFKKPHVLDPEAPSVWGKGDYEVVKIVNLRPDKDGRRSSCAVNLVTGQICD